MSDLGREDLAFGLAELVELGQDDVLGDEVRRVGLREMRHAFELGAQ